MDAMPEKNAMRREFRGKRDAFAAGLSTQDMGLAFSATPSPLKSLFISNKVIAAYIPIGSEANPAAFLTAAQEAGCKTALPHVTSAVSPMQFLQWQPGDELIEGAFGLMQPKHSSPTLTPDIVLVPLVAFDRALNRLGQGAGHYDRALSIIENVQTIGIAWSVQEAEAIPADPWDVPLDAILTEKEWISR